MEDDGNYFNLPDTITFKYQALENKLQPPPNIYNGSWPCLHRSVGKKFDRVCNCFQVCGVLRIPFFKHLTASLNQYAQLILSTNGKWKIILTEMVRFHGVMLNLSIDNKKSLRVQDLSGDRMKVNLDHDYIVNIYDYPVWAAKVFTLNRFKQICNKCHQLRVCNKNCNHCCQGIFHDWTSVLMKLLCHHCQE